MNEKTIESLIKFNSPELQKIYKQNNNYYEKRIKKVTKISDDLQTLKTIMYHYCFPFSIYYALYNKDNHDTNYNEKLYYFFVWNHNEKNLLYEIFCVKKILINNYGEEQIETKLYGSKKIIELKVTKRIEIFKYVPAFFEYIHSKEMNEHVDKCANKPYILAKHPDFKGDIPEDLPIYKNKLDSY